MKKFTTTLALVVAMLFSLSLTAWAVDPYVSGTFNNWAGTHPKYKMTQNGSEYSLTLNGVTAGTYQFKIKGPSENWDDINYGISGLYENKSIQFGMAYVMTWSGSNIQITLTETKDVTIIYNTSETTVKVTLSDPTPSGNTVTEWYVGDDINMSGKYFYYTNDLNRIIGTDPDRKCYGIYSDFYVPEPTKQTYGPLSIDHYQFDYVGYEFSEGSQSKTSLYFVISEGKTAEDVPTGFKVKSGDGTEANPYRFELIYNAKPFSGIKDAAADAAKSNIWYDLNGRCFQGKPTMPGVYINNGEKIIVQ